MAGIYLHIPFCRQACTYCNFHFTTSSRYLDLMVTSLGEELEMESGYPEGRKIQTIYFGGGTPSLLDEKHINHLVSAIYRHYPVSGDAEVTLEANPDDISKEKLQLWKDAGINRLSIGIQSFSNEELKWMNRAHDSRQARLSIEWALTRDFSNITIDLIYGSPLLTPEMWKRHVDIALEYEIPHLSCYALTVEEKTPLHKKLSLPGSPSMDAGAQSAQFLSLMLWLREAGYEHYEVSNFAKPGYRSRHNSAYWNGTPYLGIGPSAHSFNGRERRWNIANNQAYIRGISEHLPMRESEILTEKDRINEFIMISLRTGDGLDMQGLRERWGEAEYSRVLSGLQKFLNAGQAIQTGNRIHLTDKGMLVADGIASDLFLV